MTIDDFPLVSIILPTYNRANYLPYSINSVLAQSYDIFELYIIDDGSSDNTVDVVNNYLNDDRVHYIYQDNQGQSVARNEGLKRAKGDFICFLDSDDLYKPDKLVKQIDILKSNRKIDIVHGDEDLIDKDGRILSKKNMNRYSGMIYEKLLIDNSVSIITVMARKKCFDEMGGFDESIEVGDDYDLWLRFSAKYRYHYEPEYFAQYRIMDDQISSDKKRRFESNRNTIERFLKEHPDLLNKDEIKYIWCQFYIRRGRYFASQNKLKEALCDYRAALHYKFFGFIPWRAIIKLLLFRK